MRAGGTVASHPRDEDFGDLGARLGSGGGRSFTGAASVGGVSLVELFKLFLVAEDRTVVRVAASREGHSGKEGARDETRGGNETAMVRFHSQEWRARFTLRGA